LQWIETREASYALCSAPQTFLQQAGFTKIHNLTGGITAWAAGSIPRCRSTETQFSVVGSQFSVVSYSNSCHSEPVVAAKRRERVEEPAFPATILHAVLKGRGAFSRTSSSAVEERRFSAAKGAWILIGLNPSSKAKAVHSRECPVPENGPIRTNLV
jgi:hypothetical protein